MIQHNYQVLCYPSLYRVYDTLNLPLPLIQKIVFGVRLKDLSCFIVAGYRLFSLFLLQCRALIYKWRTRGLTQWQVRQLPRRRYRGSKETSETCSICLEDFKEGETIRVLPCDHGM